MGITFKYFGNERLSSELRKKSSWVKKRIVLYLRNNQSPLLEFLVFFTINFGQKRPILGRCQKNLLVILDKLFWTYPLWLGYVFFD
jgi:hypothetical protein